MMGQKSLALRNFFLLIDLEVHGAKSSAEWRGLSSNFLALYCRKVNADLRYEGMLAIPLQILNMNPRNAAHFQRLKPDRQHIY